VKRKPDLNFPNLKRLAQEKPTKIMKALRLIWPCIKRGLDEGKSLGDIQRQVAEAGITISDKLLQIYVRRLRGEDRLRNPKVQSSAKDASRGSIVQVCESGTNRKPIAFLIPTSRHPMWTDLTCWNCGQDILSCHCSSRNRPC
jgi:hypothetical protein